jgi:hypothetical protein
MVLGYDREVLMSGHGLNFLNLDGVADLVTSLIMSLIALRA